MISQRQIKHFTVDTLAQLKALTNIKPGTLTFCNETGTMYVFLPTSVGIDADDQGAVVTSYGETSRWIGGAGSYIYANWANKKFTSFNIGGMLFELDPKHGEMYQYENTTAMVISAVDTYHGFLHLITGINNGFIFKAGSTGVLATITDYSTTEAGTIKIYDPAHGLLTGEVVCLVSSSNYKGTYKITKIDDDNFYVTQTYTADETTSIWIRGASLQAGPNTSGTFKASFSLSADTAQNDRLFKCELNKNETPLDNIVSERFFRNSTDYTPMSSSGLVEVVPGDYVWLSIKNKTNVDNITVRHANINLIK